MTLLVLAMVFDSSSLKYSSSVSCAHSLHESSVCLNPQPESIGLWNVREGLGTTFIGSIKYCNTK